MKHARLFGGRHMIQPGTLCELIPKALVYIIFAADSRG